MKTQLGMTSASYCYEKSKLSNGEDDHYIGIWVIKQLNQSMRPIAF